MVLRFHWQPHSIINKVLWVFVGLSNIKIDKLSANKIIKLYKSS